MPADIASTPRRPRLDSLTGLRWWAAFAVFAYHMNNLAPLRGQSLLDIGYTGVSFFFILSGFVLTWSARRGVGARQFWWRRFARIWPAHVVALLLALPVFYTYSAPDPEHWWVKPFSLPVILLSLPLAQGFFRDPAILFSGNPAAWTLSCEAFFYFLHPLVNRRALSRRSAAVSLIVLSVAVGMVCHTVPGVFDSLPVPILRFWEFTLGMGVAHLMRSGSTVRVPTWLIYPGAAGMAALYWTLNHRLADLDSAGISFLRQVFPIVLACFFALAIWICSSADLDSRRSPFRQRALVVGGEWSYAFYLVHATVLYAVLAVIGHHPWDPVVTPVIWIGVFLGALGLSAALHLCVERPLEKRLRAWGDRRFSPVLTPPAPAPTAQAVARSGRSGEPTGSPGQS